MTYTEPTAGQSLACVTSFLWDAQVDATNTARRLDAAANRLRDSALADHPGAAADAQLAHDLRDETHALQKHIANLYAKWSAVRDHPELKDAS